MDVIDRLATLDDRDVLNVVQAASENEGTVEERLEKGMQEILTTSE